MNYRFNLQCLSSLPLEEGFSLDELKARGYKAAATYLDNAKSKMFSYVRTWLRTGVVHPRDRSAN